MKRGRVKAVIIGMVAVGWVSGATMLFAAETEDVAEPKAGGVTSIEERIERLEKAQERSVEGNKWYDRIAISGLIEVEASHQNVDYDDPAEEDTRESDVDLATVELGVDVRIVEHLDGRVLFKYEDDDLFVDEGYITLSGTETFPAYLIAGRQYIPFGYYDSFFVTDPNTLILGETTEGSVVAGYRIKEDLLDISVGAFNGDIDEAGDDDVINGFVAAIIAKPLPFLTLGASYTSSLAASNALSDAVADTDGDGEAGPIDDQVGGWSAFATIEFLERFKLIGEYVAAFDSFKAGELYDAGDTRERDLSAWNLEFGAVIVDSLELAVRYGGSDDGGDFLPETQYGAVINWGFFENTNLALEYLHDDYADDVMAADTVTAQLAIEF